MIFPEFTVPSLCYLVLQGAWAKETAGKTARVMVVGRAGLAGIQFRVDSQLTVELYGMLPFVMVTKCTASLEHTQLGLNGFLFFHLYSKFCLYIIFIHKFHSLLSNLEMVVILALAFIDNQMQHGFHISENVLT